MRVALISCNAQAGDAIGNQLGEKVAFFLDGGADVRVFVESDHRLHPAVRPCCQVLRRPEPRGAAWDFLTSADLVIVEYAQYYPLLGIVPLLANGKPRILFDYHGVTPRHLWGNHNHEALEQGARYRGLAWCADAVLAHSRFARAELSRETSWPAQRVLCLAYPIDTTHFTPGGEPSALRSTLGLERATVLLFVGRLAANKRLPVLVEAVAELRDREPPVHALLVGDTSDLYQGEVRRCRRRAADLGVADRLHFLGHVADDRLREAYRAADVFVTPSRHEGFGIPVIEAMACGLPVIAARAAALPETVAGAGVTFAPDDARDLARQVRRVLDRRAPAAVTTDGERLRVAVVSFRYGTDFAGGAERSLRTIAEALAGAGHAVEVFTTCTRAENDWKNELPEGTTELAGIPVHRFRIDDHDRPRHLESVRAVLESDGTVGEAVERSYIEHSIHSTGLVEALRQRLDEFDAVIVGPYLHGLTYDVARAFPDKTLLLGCLHDEPFARLRRLHSAYEEVGGLLYHSPEEQELAEAELGLNHPRAACVGTLLESVSGDPERGRARVGSGRRHLVYCGRYSEQKDLPTLLDQAARYSASRPGRFTFVFLGQGEVAIPRTDWARDLGFVDEASKRDVLAGADALLLPSRKESLSLVALEAWDQGAPVLADERCSVLVGHLRRGGGGQALSGYEAFAAALDDLWEHPERWRERGRQGRAYVRTQYGDAAAYVRRLEAAIRSLQTPLADRMVQRGRGRALQLDRTAWRRQFARLIEEVLDGPPRPRHEDVEVRPRSVSRTVVVGTDRVLVPVRVVNRGTHALVPDGPAGAMLETVVLDEAGAMLDGAGCATPLPGILMPGRALSAAVAVSVPAVRGSYRVRFGARSPGSETLCGEANSAFCLVVQDRVGGPATGCCGPLLDAVHTALAEVHRRQRLPDDYTDVTEGWFAAGKRWVKRKLLGNFKLAYVDVLSRQQSAVNQSLLTAVQEVAECCATLDHAGRTPAARDPAAALARLSEELAESRGRCADLEARLARLEQAVREASALAPAP